MRNRLCARILLAVLVFWAVVPASRGKDEPAEPAKLRVSGLGLWRNREMRVALERMLGPERGPLLDANAIEDTAFLLYSIVNDEGYQSPVVVIRAELADGRTETRQLDAALDVSLTRGLQARAVAFEVRTGLRSYIENVQIEGLQVLSSEAGEGFFKPTRTLIGSKAARAYSPSRVRRSAEKLREELQQRGYAQAKVEARRVDPDPAKGGPVTLHVRVEEGPLWVLSDLRFEKSDPGETGLRMADRTGRAWTPTLQQDLTEQIRQAYYRKGYADVAIRLRPEAAPPSEGRRPVVAVLQVEPGPPVKVGGVRFVGNEHTDTAILRRRVPVNTGDPLDPVLLERARYRLSRLGVFDAVDLRYEPPAGEVRHVEYVLREGPRYEANLLAGYGSYEQLRGGLEVRQMNLLGRAHQSRLELVQSMKSTRGEYSYTVPELFGETVDGTARTFGIQREELAFLRQEYGGNVSLKRPVPWIRAEGTMGYTFQSLKNRDNELTTRTADDEQVTVASIDLGLARDRRDSPLRPRRGYRWFGRAEIADRGLGGEVDYERFELGGTYHFAAGRGQYVHVGLTHGVLTTFGTTDVSVPVNKRFFPGGDGSIRGYQEGEAAPKGADGRFVGAKTYTLLNLEYEQVLTETWSAVIFIDALGAAERLADYPFDERLYSVGLGLRYQTLVGPIRLEYGRNLNRRDGDPTGTLHFAVGFPF